MVTASPAQEIVINNIGPIDQLRIPIDPQGGCTILRGKNGAGKSHALDAVSKLGGNSKVKPPIHDGAKRGEIDGLGVHVVVGASTRAIGELEVESIEGKFDLSKLVDPGIASAESANAARIRQLLTILELPVEESCFYDLAGGKVEFEALAIKPTDDVVELSGRVKRALEDRARKLEAEAERLGWQVATRMADLNEYGSDVERDAAKLNAAVEAALTRKASIDQQRLAALEHEEKRQQAEIRLAELPASNLEGLQSDFKIAQQLAMAAQEELIKAEKALEFAKREFAEKMTKKERAEELVSDEKTRISNREILESILDGAMPYKPSTETLAEATTALESARQAAELGTLARQADAKAAEARELKQQETECRKRAEQLRESARGTDEVLSDLVGKLGVDLVVHEGVLSVQTDEGFEPFARLSHGERWKLAIALGQKRVGAGGLLPIPQEAWESLDPSNRQIVANAARKYRVQVITAEAAEGELRAESYSESELEKVAG